MLIELHSCTQAHTTSPQSSVPAAGPNSTTAPTGGAATGANGAATRVNGAAARVNGAATGDNGAATGGAAAGPNSAATGANGAAAGDNGAATGANGAAAGDNGAATGGAAAGPDSAADETWNATHPKFETFLRGIFGERTAKNRLEGFAGAEGCPGTLYDELCLVNGTQCVSITEGKLCTSYRCNVEGCINPRASKQGAPNYKGTNMFPLTPTVPKPANSESHLSSSSHFTNVLKAEGKWTTDEEAKFLYNTKIVPWARKAKRWEKTGTAAKMNRLLNLKAERGVAKQTAGQNNGTTAVRWFPCLDC